MGKKILLPTDFSKNSWNAIQYAIKLYENQSCDFYILNVYSEESHGLESRKHLDPDDAFNKMAENRSKKALGEIMVRIMSENDNFSHKFHVISLAGLLVDAVKNIVKELNIDTVVMGAKGKTDENEGEYGKNTLAVIETIRNCPALVIPKNATYELPEEIVLATNFDSKIKVDELNFLAEIAKLNNASIQVLSLMDNGAMSLKQKKNKKRLRKRLKGIEHNFNVIHNVKMATALNCFIEIRHSSMISYIDKKRSFWERCGFRKPTLDKLGYFDNLPILALHG